MCQLIASAYAHLKQGDIDHVVLILADRLKNEFTRMAALKGIYILATNTAGTI